MYAKRPPIEMEPIIESTDVYSCEDDGCNAWMRKEFVTESLNCPLCGSTMMEEVRDLPQMKKSFNFY
ncbi:cold-inducible protein YdjO-related protein [Peribacillus sp. SCS-37]|uniref:cold-inducible protein YdjO-related protein n=1 Tax=Paraperibacillus esterisolvens TaxID=3115296 RepID=UPI0039064844